MISYKYQFGLKKYHSTEMAFAILNHNITTSFNKNNLTLGIFLDFSKAVDTVNFCFMQSRVPNDDLLKIINLNCSIHTYKKTFSSCS